MIVGYLLAACAALASGTGSVLESTGIRRAGIFGGTSFDLVTLRKQYVYFLGLCADLTGFVLAAAALRLLPLFLVQSVIAFSVGVTAVISALLGIRLAALGWIALAVGAGGLVLLWLSAEPTPAHTLPAGWGWMLPAAAVPSLPSEISGGRCHRGSRRRCWPSLPVWGSAWCAPGSLPAPWWAWRWPSRAPPARPTTRPPVTPPGLRSPRGNSRVSTEQGRKSHKSPRPREIDHTVHFRKTMALLLAPWRRRAG